MNDLSVKVMIGIAWVFGVVNVAPDVLFILLEQGQIPTIGDLSPSQSEMIYVAALAAIGPLVIWLLSRRRRAAEWKEWEKEDQ